jgi:hypothetical protein
MKALTTPSGNFGPFNTIEVLSDRYCCDNTDLPFSVVGQGEIVEADTITWPEPPVPPVPVPQSVTMRQARLALHAAGLLAGVDAAIASMQEPAKTAAAIEWEYASAVERNAGLVPAMAAALGMSEADIDDLFITAATL